MHAESIQYIKFTTISPEQIKKLSVAKLTVPDIEEVERLTEGFTFAVQATNSFRTARNCQRMREGVDAAVAACAEPVRLANTIQLLGELTEARATHVAHPMQPVTEAILTANQGIEASKTLVNGIILLGQCQTLLERVVTAGQQLTKVDEDVQVANASIQEVQSQMQEGQKVACPSCGHKFDPFHTCEAADA